ncbi:hypothetical protein BD413DRAFT_611651 [Trametes elegans]|nr:hypothetical protein BD413DRAFT_611651 [Trametes elegans]
MCSALLAFVLAAVNGANALLRFPCSQMTVVRSDPLINPGNVGQHLHQVGAFDFVMPDGMDLQAESTCSSCSIVENKSNYWTPTLYYRSPTNGTFVRVPQAPGPLTGSPNAGMVVYYIQTGGTTKAFPKGFRMISGDPWLRSYDASIDDSRSITFRCLQPNDASGNGPETHGLPTTPCAGGIRSQINFPTCWDGKNLDSPNHKDHARYAINASFGDFGQGCPPTHPIQLPLLYLETYWDTTAFNSGWQNGQQPFVWSMGDPTGYGYHADYMMGWPEDVLQQAMDQCTDYGGQVSSCPVLHTRSEQDMNDCAVPPRVDETFDGYLKDLPGCNPVQNGPGRATPASGCGAPTTTLKPDQVSWLKAVDGWQAIGCAAEPLGQSILTGGTTTSASMTIESCLSTCKSKNLQFAGLKNGNTCSCGSSFDTSKVSVSYACNFECTGNPGEFCGAANRLAVYNNGSPVSVPTATQPLTTAPASQTSGQTVAKYGQCGGQGYTGPTVCEEGSTCKTVNPYYSQCL